MIKFLIVEDEDTIREGLQHLLDWERYGLVLCGTAANGVEGLDMIRRESPGLVITDIRMPHMDGLEMIRRAREQELDFDTILLSGYGDFEYARQGLALGIKDYLLKPCRPQELEASVARVIDRLKKRQSQNGTDPNLPYAKQRALSAWCRYSGKPLEDRKKIMADLKMRLAYTSIQAGIARFERRAMENRYTSGDWELIGYAAENIIAEILSEVYVAGLETFRTEHAVVWVGNCDGLQQQRLEETLRKAQRQLRAFLKLETSFGIGERQPTIETLQRSYEQAEKALKSRFYQGIGGIYHYRGTRSSGDQETLWDDDTLAKLEANIKACLQNGEYARLLDGVEQWLECVRSVAPSHRDKIHLKATAFIVELKSITQQLPVRTFPWKDTMVNWTEQLPQVQTFDELSMILKKIVQNIVESLKKETALHRTVQAALDIIHARYATNLTLESVARETFVSASYLSTLFKQELGVNFLDYLHQYRIERAKPLLAQNLKVFAVAKLVGYQDEKHFSATFKKWTGLTPMQYRKNAERLGAAH
ncbi:MAG: hypothetical protein C6W55_12410 [Thermobacillus sp.]|uniref:response regulator n=1 Tax=Thermobacillus sp. TaxID=2108467 RepID=UPI000E36BB13|nr:response regulator [Thermobacillus sp.]REK54311.1 MAG: hypothetical protein C6W55_12410 [Thermobacillus sp.]